MSRVAEIAVPNAVPSSNKPGRADTREATRDSGEFSSLIDEDATAAEVAVDTATQSIKASEGGEPSVRPDHASAHALMVTSLLAGPAADGAVVDPAAVADASLLPDAALEHASAGNGLPGAVAAVIAAVTEGADQAGDGSADSEIASPDAASTPDGTNMVVAGVTVAPSIVTPTAADVDQQAVPAMTIAPAGDSPAIAAPVDAELASQTRTAQADAALPEGTTLAPNEAKAQTTSPNLPIPASRSEASNAPLSGPADNSATATKGKPEAAAASVEAAATAEQTHKPPAAPDDGSLKDAAAKIDAAPAVPSDSKPAVAPTQTASAQVQPSQIAPDALTIAPAAANAAQPALLQAQLIATPAGPDAPVPVEGLAIEITVRAASGKSRFEIRLDPPELGRIDVRLDIDRHGRVGTHLTVEKVETLDMLRRDAPQLERALADSGLKTGDGGLQFSLRDQSFAGRGDQNEGRQQSARLIISDEDTVPAAVAERSYRMAGAAGGLDIRV